MFFHYIFLVIIFRDNVVIYIINYIEKKTIKLNFQIYNISIIIYFKK